MITLLVGLIAHRLKTVRLLATATALMVLSGIGYAFETEFWPLLVIALVGTLSPTASDVSVFAPLEQTLLSNAVVPQRRTSIFATYSLIGSVLSAVGCLFASAPEIVARASLMPPNRAPQGMFLIYAFLGAIAFMIYRQLKSPAEVPVSEPARGPLGPSRRIVFTLAALFSLDSFGGGFFVRASHPTGLTIARIKTTSRLICTRRSGGVRSSLIFGPRCGLRTVGTDMVGLHIGFRTRPRPVPTEPDQQDRNSSTPKASCSRLDRILFMSGNRAPSASVA